MPKSRTGRKKGRRRRSTLRKRKRRKTLLSSSERRPYGSLAGKISGDLVKILNTRGTGPGHRRTFKIRQRSRLAVQGAPSIYSRERHGRARGAPRGAPGGPKFAKVSGCPAGCPRLENILKGAARAGKGCPAGGNPTVPLEWLPAVPVEWLWSSARHCRTTRAGVSELQDRWN